MNKLQCELCGGSLSMDSDGESAVCDFCGMRFKKEYIKSMLVEISGPIKIDGLASLEKLIQNGEKFLELWEYDNAEQVFTKISNEYPECHHGWWGIFCALTENFNKMFTDDPDRLYSLVVNTLKTAPETEKGKLTAKYDEWLVKMRKFEAEEAIKRAIKSLEEQIQAAKRELTAMPYTLKKTKSNFSIWLSIGILDIIFLIPVLFFSLLHVILYLAMSFLLMLVIADNTFWGGKNSAYNEIKSYNYKIEQIKRNIYTYECQLTQAKNDLYALTQNNK